jgi:Zn-dependent peptidase ImmA (M78 family)
VPSGDTRSRAARDAATILTWHWDGSLPVDPIAIARENGVEVFDVKLPDDVSGAIEKGEGENAVIYLEVRDHENRRRFSCAHELGHFFDNDKKGKFSYVDYRSESSHSEDEVYANEFAARLLMPDEHIEELLKDLRGDPSLADLARAARRFKVSPHALRVRLDKARKS